MLLSVVVGGVEVVVVVVNVVVVVVVVVVATTTTISTTTTKQQPIAAATAPARSLLPLPLASQQPETRQRTKLRRSPLRQTSSMMILRLTKPCILLSVLR